MPALLVYAAGAVLVGIGYRVFKKEWQRINRELEEQDVAHSQPVPPPAKTLRRDPKTGVWQ